MDISDEQLSSLRWQLNILGFANTTQILSTAQVFVDDSVIETKNVAYLRMIDENEKEGAKFIFLASQAAGESWKIHSIKTYKSYEINPSTKETREYMAECEMTLLLDKKHMLQKVEATYLLDKAKIELLANKELRDQLFALGFKDYEYMVANTVAWFDRPVLSASFKLPEGIGTGNDEVQFNIWLGNIKDKEPQKIKCIYATYESPVKIISDPDFTGSQVFTPRKGEFPSVEAMTNTVLTRYRDWFLGAAKAFQVHKNLQKAGKNRGRNRKKGL